VAGCLKDHVRLRGLEVFPEKLIPVRQRKRKRYMDASQDSEMYQVLLKFINFINVQQLYIY
jgi:hypothetical protein